MTNQEREELIRELRDPSLHTVLETCDKAANEIEWLVGRIRVLEEALAVSRAG
jgi:hypothetical protein